MKGVGETENYAQSIENEKFVVRCFFAYSSYLSALRVREWNWCSIIPEPGLLKSRVCR
jgi:hypothetical protein